jgi:hypothetical protein
MPKTIKTITFLATFVLSSYAHAGVLGDIDGDGHVGFSEAVYALQSLSDIRSPLANGDALKNIITVAKANGNFSDPVAAVNSITDASVNNPYLVLIGPGVYTITQTLQIKEHVDIVGSGENNTKIKGAISTGNYDASSAIISGANNSMLSSLSIENMGGGDYSTALFNYQVSPTVINLTALAAGGAINRGICNISSSSPTMKEVTATALGGGDSCGVYNFFSSPTMTDFTATASGATKNCGIFNYASSPTMTNVTTRTSGGDENMGVENRNNSYPKMTNVTADASEGSSNTGVYNYSSLPTMTNVIAMSYGGSYNCGVYNESSSTPMTNVTASGVGGSNSYGVRNLSSSPVMTNVTATAFSGGHSYGVYNASSSPGMTDVTATASGVGDSYGVYNISSSPVMTNVTATASGDINSYGICNHSSSPKIRRSTMEGATYGLFNVDSISSAVISQSTVIGGILSTLTNTCVACDNGNGSALNAGCQ